MALAVTLTGSTGSMCKRKSWGTSGVWRPTWFNKVRKNPSKILDLYFWRFFPDCTMGFITMKKHHLGTYFYFFFQASKSRKSKQMTSISTNLIGFVFFRDFYGLDHAESPFIKPPFGIFVKLFPRETEETATLPRTYRICELWLPWLQKNDQLLQKISTPKSF